MGEIHEIAQWRARRASREDVPIGAPPFVLEEPCSGCGAERVATMVWRRLAPDTGPVPFPRIEPHFLCRNGRVACQEILDAPLSVLDWSRILGHFEEARAASGKMVWDGVASDAGSDAGSRDEGDALASSRSGVAADGPAPPQPEGSPALCSRRPPAGEPTDHA